MGLIPDHEIQQVRDCTDIVGLVSQYIQLKQAGRGFKGLCPFHEEKTPSFSVSDKGFYKCFGCQEGGDAITFLMQIENLSFVEATQQLARNAGITLSYEERGARPLHQERVDTRECLEKTLEFFRQQLSLPAGGRGLGYLLRDRSFSRETLEAHDVGFAPAGNQLLKYLTGLGYSNRCAVDAGVVGEGDNGTYDRFQNRVVFPIRDARGNLAGFGGRAFPEDIEQGAQSERHIPKYLNSPEGTLYQKSMVLYLFNEAAKHAHKEGRRGILVEGYTDALLAHERGLPQTFASAGTALTDQQAHVINRSFDQVVVAFDADGPGAEATIKGARKLLDVGLQVHVLQLPAKQDFYDFVLAQGEERVRQRLDQATPLFEFELGRAMIGVEKLDTVQQQRVLKTVLPSIASCSSIAHAALCLNSVSDHLHVPLEFVQLAYAEYVKPSEDVRESYSPAEEQFNAIALMARSPATRRNFTNRLEPEQFEDASQRLLFEFLRYEAEGVGLFTHQQPAVEKTLFDEETLQDLVSRERLTAFCDTEGITPDLEGFEALMWRIKETDLSHLKPESVLSSLRLKLLAPALEELEERFETRPDERLDILRKYREDYAEFAKMQPRFGLAPPKPSNSTPS